MHDPATCRHEVVDRRGSSRSISRTFCKQCGTFIDEVPGEFHAQRRTAASKVLDATSNALDVINAMTNKEAVTDYSPEAVEAILGAFNDRVLQAIQDEDRVDDIVLHDHLREAIAKTVEDPDSPWSDVGRTSPTPVAMMVYDEHGEPVFDTTGMPYSKAKAKAFGKGPRAVIWPPYQGTRMDPVVRSNLMTAHWAAFANRLLRNYARKYMFKFWKIEKRRRAIIMRQNMARRTLIRTNPQYGPFRPIDIHECSSDSDDEPTISVARASSDAPTAAPGLPRQPVARIDRALDVLNAPGSTRQEFQAYFNPRNLGPGDLEELSPELWEEFRLDGAAGEYDLHMQDLADEEAQGTEPDLDRPPGLSEAAIADVPRTTLSGLEEQNPELHRDIIIGIQAARDRDPRDPESPLISEPEADDLSGSHGPGGAPGASSTSRTAQGRRWQPRPPHGGPHNVALAGCDVSYQSDLVRVDTLPVVDMWSPEEDHIWGALDEGCNSTCHSKAWGELAEDRLRAFGLTFPCIDGSTKSFAGLGSSTKTLGKRNLPFCIQVGEDSLAGAMESHEVDTEAFNPLLVSLFAQAKLGLIKDMAQSRCYIGDLEVPMARCTHTGLLLLCLSQFARRSKLPRVVESLRVPSPGTRLAMMLAPSHWHVDGYTWDPNGPIAAQDHVWPDLMIVTAGVKHCFPAGDHRGVSNPDAWRSSLPKAIANRKIILTDTRQLPNPETDRANANRHCIGRHTEIVNEQLSSGTGMYLLQSTFEATQRETKLTKQLVVLDFCNANRHRSVAKGTIMSCMLVAKGIEHGLLHLNGMNSWRFMRCGGSCSNCRSVDPATATSIAERAFKKFLPHVNDHDTSDSAYQQRRPLSVSVAPGSATPGPRSTSAIRGPPATYSSAAGRTSSRPPPTSSSHSISILGPCGTFDA